jgi:pilus assembly protein CpaF
MKTFKLGQGRDENAEADNPSTQTPAAGVAAPRSGDLPPDVQEQIVRRLYDIIKPEAINQLSRDELLRQVEIGIARIADESKLQVSGSQQQALARMVADDMRGIGPLQALLEDESVTDIMVNGPEKVFVERRGRLHLTNTRFRDDNHVRSIAQRIARQVGRRVDEANPICDARLSDGSRVNIVIPPIALDGTMISIRRFPTQWIDLDQLVSFQTISPTMRAFLEIAAKCRLNTVISGGTSSGKTTILNAMSQFIGTHESVITIEDSAELRLRQPNVRRLETRPAAMEGLKEITQRDLVRSALRMRPDRIILGEVRGSEAFDMLQAMNTGHEGSMGTLHANSTRDALARLENMILMAVELPIKAIRAQIASAVDLIIQVERMTDGVRRVTRISEVTGMEGEIISMQDLFDFEIEDVKANQIIGRHRTMQVTLHSIDKMKRFGMHNAARLLFSRQT